MSIASRAFQAVAAELPAKHLEEPDVDAEVWCSTSKSQNRQSGRRSPPERWKGDDETKSEAVALAWPVGAQVCRYVPATVKSFPTNQPELDSSARWFRRSQRLFILPAAYSWRFVFLTSASGSCGHFVRQSCTISLAHMACVSAGQSQDGLGTIFRHALFWNHLSWNQER